MSATLSVIIPVFNRPGAVCHAINSVLAQTWQDFEIIVVDDGSTDNTAAAVSAFSDPRIAIIRHSRNRGGSAARNTGVRASSGAYIAFLDSDDEWLPTKLERQLQLFRQGGDRCGLVYSGAERILPDGSVARHMACRRDRRDLARKLLTDNVIGGASVAIVRRQVFDEVDGFDESLPSGQDVDFWLRVCQQYPAEFVPEVLVRIWQRDGAGRISSNVDASIKGRALFCQKHGEKLMRAGVLHIWLRQSGWVHHRYARDVGKARQLYLAAIREQPLAPVTYILFLLACLPLSWLDGLAWCKRLIIKCALWPFASRADFDYQPAHRSSPEAQGDSTA